ncbi:MAG: tRNA uracil 4-sulfurtransferase ThiI [bacterium]|nr:tRNA uracil 4-sulfurtransferase ThiI [bacterium]MDZ4296437.1 tRNA uracil 4-sulfurtransferase ThiI [Patescibacteria group bacterium]
MDVLLIHCAELMLKGRNRPLFLRALKNNITRAAQECGGARVAAFSGGLCVTPEPGSSVAALAGRLRPLPGIANLMPVWRAQDLAALKERLAPELGTRQFGAFRISAHRSDKTFPVSSGVINREVGEWVRVNFGARVDLENPDLTIFIIASSAGLFFGFEKIEGIGGLPAGTSGTVVSLLSGGIDSPVASWMLMKRGCRVVFVHFHSYPYLSRVSQEKAEALAKILDRAQADSVLYLVPIGDSQREMLTTAPAPLRVVLYRRLMFRIASAIGQKEGAGAIATGESLGQVASQTLTNMAVVGNVATLPVLRPLVGMNKVEIIAQARAIGTYETSIIPDQDCCQLFVPEHPVTKTSSAVIERIEATLDMAGFVVRALEAAEVKQLSTASAAAMPSGVL